MLRWCRDWAPVLKVLSVLWLVLALFMIGMLGTGLVNVRERLVAHFGPTASLAAGPADGGFAVTLDFPAWKDVSA